MINSIDYYGKLKFFFTHRGEEIDKEANKQLDLMSDEEIKTLYDIVFAENQKERLNKINKIYIKMEDKQNNAQKNISYISKEMNILLQGLEEILEKNINEINFNNKF